jgi:hypothetical protein
MIACELCGKQLRSRAGRHYSAAHGVTAAQAATWGPDDDVPPPARRCSRCDRSKPPDAFYATQTGGWCKDCRRAYARRRRRRRVDGPPADAQVELPAGAKGYLAAFDCLLAARTRADALAARLSVMAERAGVDLARGRGLFADGEVAVVDIGRQKVAA